MAVFDQLEKTEYGGEPIEFYLFTMGTENFGFTTDSVFHTVEGITYQPAYINRRNFKQSNDLLKNTLKIRIERDNPVALLFQQAITKGAVNLVIRRTHRTANDIVIFWTGQVISCDWGDERLCILSCEPFSTIFLRTGLRRNYQITCPHSLFCPYSCKVNPAAFTHTDTITHFAGKTVTLANTYSLNYFQSGYINIEGYRSQITSSVGDTVVLAGFLPSLDIGKSVVLVAGCDRSFLVCREKYNNELNYGGFTHIPDRNPFRVSLMG